MKTFPIQHVITGSPPGSLAEYRRGWQPLVAPRLHNRVALAWRDRIVEYDLRSAAVTAERPLKTCAVLPLPGGLTGVTDRDELLYLGDGLRPVYSFAGHTASIRGLLWLSGERLLSYGDSELRIWNLADRYGQVLCGHEAAVNNVALLQDASLVSLSNDNTLRHWRGRPLACATVFAGHRSPPMGVRDLGDGRLFSKSMTESIVWELGSGRLLARLEGVPGSPSRNALVGAHWVAKSNHDDDGYRILVWNLTTGAREPDLEGHAAYVNGILALDENRLVSWSDDGTLRIWNVPQGELEAELGRAGDAPVEWVARMPSGNLLAHARDGRWREWDLAATTCVIEVNGAEAAQIERMLDVICSPAWWPEGLQEGDRFAFASGKQIIAGKHGDEPLVWDGAQMAIPAWIGAYGEVVATNYDGELILLGASSRG